jgi:hypothetical protein
VLVPHAALDGPTIRLGGAEDDALEIDLSPLKKNNRLRHLSIILSNES